MFRTLLTLGLVAYLTGSCRGADIRLGNRALNYDSFRDEEANDEFSDRLYEVTSKTTKHPLQDWSDDPQKAFRKEHMYMGGPSFRGEEETSSEKTEITTLRTPGDSPLNKTLSNSKSHNLQSLHIVIDATDDEKQKQCKICKRKKNKKNKKKKKSKKGKNGRRRTTGKPCRICEEPYFNPKWIKTEIRVYKDGELKRTRRLPRVGLGEEAYFILSGFPHQNKENYEREYFSNLTQAIQQNNPYARIFAVPIIILRNYVPYIDIQAAIATGAYLAEEIDQFVHPKAEIIMIGHDLGNVVLSTCVSIINRPIRAIFGLDQRLLPHEFGSFYLRKDMGITVQTLTTRPIRYNMGDRNFYPNGGCIPPKTPDCFACNSYKLLATDISKKGQAYYHHFCDTYEDYKANKCNAFPKASIFNMERVDVVPGGNYYTTIKDQVTRYLTSTATGVELLQKVPETDYGFPESCDTSQLKAIVY